MKHIITIGALLAAGTACAGTTGTSLYNYETASEKDMSKNGWTYGDTYPTKRRSFQGVMDAKDTSWKTEGTVGAWRFCDASSGGAFYAYIDIGEKIASYTTFSVNFNLQLDSHAYYTNGEDGATDYFKKNGSTKESVSLCVGDGTGVYYLKFGNNNGTITAIDAGTAGAQAVSLTSLKWNDLMDMAISVNKTSGTATFSVGSDTVSLTRTMSTLQSYKSRVLLGTISSRDEGDLAIASVSIIPEPSAFGLLVGVGALALVAARRRRRNA